MIFSIFIGVKHQCFNLQCQEIEKPSVFSYCSNTNMEADLCQQIVFAVHKFASKLATLKHWNHTFLEWAWWAVLLEQSRLNCESDLGQRSLLIHIEDPSIWIYLVSPCTIESKLLHCGNAIGATVLFRSCLLHKMGRDEVCVIIHFYPPFIHHLGHHPLSL